MIYSGKLCSIWRSDRGKSEEEQGRIHGNPVADGWAGAAVQRTIASLEIFVTVRHGKVYSRVSATKKVTIAFLMDVEKALDVLDYNILKKRLVDAPYAPKTKRIVSSFITDRTLYVYDGDTISETVEMSAGAPQGAILSPSLYTICAHDVPIINDEDEGGAQYADDSILWATGRNVREVVAHIERRLKVMERW